MKGALGALDYLGFATPFFAYVWLLCFSDNGILCCCTRSTPKPTLSFCLLDEIDVLRYNGIVGDTRLDTRAAFSSTGIHKPFPLTNTGIPSPHSSQTLLDLISGTIKQAHPTLRAPISFLSRSLHAFAATHSAARTMCHENVVRNRCGHTISSEVFRCGQHVAAYDRAVAAGVHPDPVARCVAGKFDSRVQTKNRPCSYCDAEDAELARAMGRKPPAPRKARGFWGLRIFGRR